MPRAVRYMHVDPVDPEGSRGWGAVRLVRRKGVGVQETRRAVVGPRRRLREALLRIGGDLHAPEEHIGAEVRAALCELAARTRGGRSCAGLVTVGGADDRAGRSLGLRLADYDVGLPEVLLRADESGLPPQVRESCPALVQEEWEAALLLSSSSSWDSSRRPGGEPTRPGRTCGTRRVPPGPWPPDGSAGH